jgi:acyl-CoA thioester hydrolase
MFIHKKKVEFGDTDMAGIVHFSNFFRYMESAETAFLRSKGLTVSWVEAGLRYGFPRVSVTCDFQSPAFFEDEISIAVTLERIGTKSLSYRFDFSRGETLLAVGKLTSVYCQSQPDHRMVGLVIPDALKNLLRS